MGVVRSLPVCTSYEVMNLEQNVQRSDNVIFTTIRLKQHLQEINCYQPVYKNLQELDILRQISFKAVVLFLVLC